MNFDFDLDGLDFTLEPIFVIKSVVSGNNWYLERIEFNTSTGDIARRVFWTSTSMQAMHFHDREDVNAFASSQFGTRTVTVKEL